MFKKHTILLTTATKYSKQKQLKQTCLKNILLTTDLLLPFAVICRQKIKAHCVKLEIWFLKTEN